MGTVTKNFAGMLNRKTDGGVIDFQGDSGLPTVGKNMNLEGQSGGGGFTPTEDQLAAMNSGIDSTKVGQIATNAQDITAIEGKIPAAATSENQLADKAFVNSSIATNTATFRGTYNLVSDLSLTTDATEQQIATALATAITTVENNDYCFVQIPTSDETPTQISRIDRYKYNGTAWAYEYSLNNSSFTASQWASINSGITSTDVTKLGGIEAGAEVNDINSISVNGTAVTPDANKNVDLTIGGGSAPFVITYSSSHFDKTLEEIKAAWDAHLPIWVWHSTSGSLVQVSRMQNTAFPADSSNAYSNVTDSICRLYGYSMQTTDNYKVGVKHWLYQMNTTTGNVIIETYSPTKIATILDTEPSSVSNLSNTYSTLSQVGLKIILNKLVINGGTTTPTTSTDGVVGTLYSCVNNGTPEIYMCTDTTGGTYTWTKV